MCNGVEGAEREDRQTYRKKEKREGGKGEREVNKPITGHRAGSAVKNICCASGDLGSVPAPTSWVSLDCIYSRPDL